MESRYRTISNGGFADYGWVAQPKGKQLAASYDTSTNLRSTPGYDALNRMTSVLYRNQDCTYNSLMQWTYDRYGNRWTQTVSGGAGAASQPSVQFDLISKTPAAIPTSNARECNLFATCSLPKLGELLQDGCETPERSRIARHRCIPFQFTAHTFMTADGA